MTRREDERGSVLLETMVATLIIAALVGVMFQSIAEGTRRSRALDERRAALLVAQSVMAQAGVTLPLEGRTTGADGGFTWTLESAPYAAASSDAGALRKVRVAVRRGEAAPVISLSSLRLTPEAG